MYQATHKGKATLHALWQGQGQTSLHGEVSSFFLLWWELLGVRRAQSRSGGGESPEAQKVRFLNVLFSLRIRGKCNESK